MTGKMQVPTELLNQGRAHPSPTVERATRLAYIGRAAASGDEGALEKLLRTLVPEMLRVMRVVLGARHPDMDQVMHDCVLDFISSLGQLPGESCVSVFALTIAFRQALAVKLGQRDQPVPTLFEESAPELFPELASRRAVIADLLTALPPPQAEALGLRMVVGLSIDEIARATGATTTTVRGRLRLAKESLRIAIERDPELRGLVAMEATS
jgi:RNA polymerase sigma-70 factor (ECF subfamily)